ncbi:tRNA pseudouridine synthase TruC [Chitinimonas prasina]|uniref:tRNA pseudouridine synthase C n=1 Tax=Chitinimonas prasina TaxID=1434937 RepID=A0ABQ5YP97_9NEIS|nr:pseudouridine synthase [Chitinimonas prasina]GLR15220.1 tRNA pseudouridine synthase TruC [Chitinimonas prasina]
MNYHHPILYRDERLVAIHKPSGLLVHRSEIDRHETRFALQEVRDQLGQRVHAIHRLDKGTSGILLFGLDADAARAVSQQFEAGTVEKRYLAVVRGWPDDAGEINHPLSRQYDSYERMPDQLAPPQEAITRYRRLATAELPHSVDRYPQSRYALLELDPLTGRKHQLRRHLKHLSHPIIGDATYGKGKHNRLFTELYGNTRLLLACTRLAFSHPDGGARIIVDAPLAEDFSAVCRALGWTA